MNRFRLLAVLTLLFLAAPASAKVTRYLTGSRADMNPPLAGPVLNLGGGGSDVDAGLQAMIDLARGCSDCATKVDVVILRTTGSDGYNSYIYAMNGVDSVETLVITRVADSNTVPVEVTIRNAEVVFFAGGDQCTYRTLFKGTAVERAVEHVYARGGAVGGTSAGMAIQGELTYDFFAWDHMGGVLTDTHFVARDRMGRLMGFLARQIKDGRAHSALGIAGDEVSSLVVDASGLATVMGVGAVYVVLADHAPEQCAPKKPLTYSNFKIWRLSPGDVFDLQNRPTSGYYTVSVRNGVLSKNPY